MTDVWYTLEQINSFIQATIGQEPRQPNPEEAKAAAWALLAALQGRDIRKDLGIAKQRGERGKEFDPDDYTLDHPAMGVVLQWRSGELKYTQAVEEFMRITGAKEATAKQVMKQLRPRAEESIKAFDLMYALATETEPPKRNF